MRPIRKRIKKKKTRFVLTYILSKHFQVFHSQRSTTLAINRLDGIERRVINNKCKKKTFYISFRIFFKRSSIGLHVNPYRIKPRTPVIDPFLVKIRSTKQSVNFQYKINNNLSFT